MWPFIEPVRTALRSLRRHPGFSLFAVGVLALTLGGATLLLSLYDSIALRTLPVRAPDELVSVRELTINERGESGDFGRVSLSDFEQLRDAATEVAALSAYASGEAILASGERVERVEAQWVDSRYFDVLGVSLERGRGFADDDDPRRGGGAGVVLAHDVWVRWFGADPGVVGRSLAVDGRTREILGVAPAGFHGFDVGAAPALFALAAEVPANWATFHLFGRLRDGATRDRLEALLAGAHAAIRAEQPGRRSFLILDGKSSQATERIQVVDGARGESALRGAPARALLLVGGMLLLVLLVLAANLANLLATRALTRRGDAAIRLALGAPRSHLALAWFAESLLLSSSAALLGNFAAAAAGPALLAWAPLPAWVHGLAFEPDARSLGVSLVLAAATALLVGALAGWEQARVAPDLRLREESPTSTQARAGVRWRSSLLSIQVALSMILLVAMGLFGRSVESLLAIETGLPLEQVLTFRLDLPESEATTAARTLGRLREELAAQPGVVAVGRSRNPVLGGVRSFAMASIEGYAPTSGEILMLDTVAVDAGYFEALELPVVAGRVDAQDDGLRDTRSIAVNRRFAERYFDGVDPIGRRLSFDFQRGGWDEPREGDLTIAAVVDDRVVGDVREKPSPRIYAGFGSDGPSATFYLRALGSPDRLRATVERLARRIAPGAALGEMRTLAQQRNRSLRRELLIRDLASTFGLAAALLSALGLFAALSYLVRGRRRELGLRQALGATPWILFRRVLLDGLRPVAWGLLAGLAAALLLAELAESQVYGISARDPLAFAAAALLMAGIGVAAAWLPAAAAARTDPSRALRDG